MIGFARKRLMGGWLGWWRDRKIDWKTHYLNTWNHPHRELISRALKSFHWISLLEVGCGAGANLVKIVKDHPGKQLGGIDINPDAIKLAQETFGGGYFKVNPFHDIMMSDNSADVVLTDMALIYVDPFNIHRVLHEIKRIARNYVVFCEFHIPSFWHRLAVFLRTGYYGHDFKKELEREGFYDIILFKLPREAWPGGVQEQHGYIIRAKVPKRK